MTVDFLTEPAGDGGEVAATDGGPDVDVLQHSVEHLCAISGAEGVAGEVADEAGGPVGVLEVTGGVVRDGDAEVLLVHLISRGGHIGGTEVAGEHALFQLIADHDVHEVGQLVSLGAYQRRERAVDAAIERLGVEAFGLVGVVLTEDRQQSLAEGATAID